MLFLSILAVNSLYLIKYKYDTFKNVNHITVFVYPAHPIISHFTTVYNSTHRFLEPLNFVSHHSSFLSIYFIHIGFRMFPTHIKHRFCTWYSPLARISFYPYRLDLIPYFSVCSQIPLFIETSPEYLVTHSYTIR